jgi:hypothetical protein
MDFHHNVFFYYRGQARTQGALERQLENNTTKALINVIEHSSDFVKSEFLKWLKIDSPRNKMFFELPKAEIAPERIPEAIQKVLLGIVGGDRAETVVSPKLESEGLNIPDAWIYGENFVVLVESKMGEKLDENQLRRHLERLNGNREHICRRTWSELHQLFSRLESDRLSELDRFLCTQFTEYLESIGMASVKEISAERFDLLLDSEDVDGKRWVRAMMKQLAETVVSRDMDILHCKVGNSDKTPDGYNVWATLSAKERHQDEAHITLQIFPHGFEVFANVETVRAVKKLRKLIDTNRSKLWDALSALDGFLVSVTKRVNMGTPRNFDYQRVKETESGSNLSDYSFEKIIDWIMDVDKNPYPQFSVRKYFSKDEIVDLKDKLPDNMLDIARQLRPLVNLIND